MQHMKEMTLQDLAASEKGKVEAEKQLREGTLINFTAVGHNNDKLSQDLEYSKSQQVVAQAQLKRQSEETIAKCKDVTTMLAEWLETSRNTENLMKRKLEEVEDELSRTQLETRDLETQITSCRNIIEASNQVLQIL
jgi:hypothetical protein